MLDIASKWRAELTYERAGLCSSHCRPFSLLPLPSLLSPSTAVPSLSFHCRPFSLHDTKTLCALTLCTLVLPRHVPDAELAGQSSNSLSAKRWVGGAKEMPGQVD